MRRRGIVALVLILVAAGCSSGERSADTAGPAKSSTGSRPFTISGVPDGFELVAAGAGEGRPEWLDTDHSTPNLVVLRPVGGSADDDVLVSAGGGGRLVDLGPGGHLVFVDRPEPGLQVQGRASESELWAIAGTVTLDDRTQVPIVADPPKGWMVVGSVSGEAALALDTQLQVGTGVAPGPRSAHTVAWRGAQADLTVMTLPGRSISLDVVAEHPEALMMPTIAERRTVAGHDMVVVGRSTGLEPDDVAPLPITVLSETSFGDVAVVSVQPQPLAPPGAEQSVALPSVNDLVRLAASVRPASASSWSSMVDRVHGRPGLHPDLGTTQLAAGTVDGHRWILQDGPGACLKFANGERACTRDALIGGSPIGPIGERRASAGEGPVIDAGTGRWSGGWFVTVVRSRPGRQLRLVTRSGETEAPFEQVGDEDRWAAVVFSDQGLSLFTLRCPPLAGKPEASVIDADGSTTCLTDTPP